jgi:5-methylcytosine-specific restriction endonuclease McrA
MTPLQLRQRPILGGVFGDGRREVFERSRGCCHYCRTPLTLDGQWHVEHMLPRALGGTDDELNLVAACAPCNLAKRDRTALEFVAEQAASEPRRPDGDRAADAGVSTPEPA